MFAFFLTFGDDFAMADLSKKHYKCGSQLTPEGWRESLACFNQLPVKRSGPSLLTLGLQEYTVDFDMFFDLDFHTFVQKVYAVIGESNSLGFVSKLLWIESCTVCGSTPG